VQSSDHREFGRAFLEVTGGCELFDGLWQAGDREQVWMSHGDRVVKLPPGFRVVGVSDGAPFASPMTGGAIAASCSIRRSCTRRFRKIGYVRLGIPLPERLSSLRQDLPRFGELAQTETLKQLGLD
jgi:hypothetical protein